MGSPSPPKASTKGTQATSQFKNVSGATFSTPFGEGLSKIGYDPTNPKRNYLETSLQNIDPRISGAFNTGLDAIQPNMQWLNQTPDQLFQYAQSSPLYAQLMQQNNRATDQAQGRALVDAQRGGLQNSTTLGGALGTINNDAINRQNQALLQSADYGRQMATQNLGTAGGTIADMYNLISPLAGAANQNFIHSMDARDNVAQSNAQNMTSLNSVNAQIAGQMAMQPSPWAQAASALGSAAGMFL